MTNRQKRTTYLDELGPEELYRRGKDVVPGSELKIGETIVIDGWPYTIIEKPKQVTREQALLLIDLAVKMVDDGAAGKRRALWYLRRMIPIVLPVWIELQVPIQNWTANDLITTGRLILDGGVFDEASGTTCEEIAAMDDDECPCCQEGGE